MRRAPIVLSATAAGTVAVLAFKPHQPTLATAGAPAALSRAPSTPSSPSGGSSSGGSTSSARPATATGNPITTRYGTTQVRVTISGGKITRIEALQLNQADPKSVQISVVAEPILRQTALAKQTANIDAVSGATVTSDAYKASLQSALDKAHFTSSAGRASTQAPQDEGGPGGPPPGGGYGPP